MEGAPMPPYLMEHPLEAERLELKTQRAKILEELKLVPLRPGMDVLDVGCGTGAVTRILAERVSPGRVIGLDVSEERLAVAKDLAKEHGVSNVEYRRADVRDLDAEKEGFDLVYSRFLFQYLPGKDGLDTLAAMKRMARPAGHVTVADIDGNHLYRYPLDEEWEEVLRKVVHGIEQTGFDAFVGRKLFSMFRQVGFGDVRVNILPYYLLDGKADPLSLRIWEMKVEILAKTLKNIFESDDTINEMTKRFKADLMDENTLLYNFLFMVQGSV
jgi:ubiquinone/menaquinone biosynthesis C-methylase UbiE